MSVAPRVLYIVYTHVGLNINRLKALIYNFESPLFGVVVANLHKSIKTMNHIVHIEKLQRSKHNVCFYVS